MTKRVKLQLTTTRLYFLISLCRVCFFRYLLYFIISILSGLFLRFCGSQKKMKANNGKGIGVSDGEVLRARPPRLGRRRRTRGPPANRAGGRGSGRSSEREGWKEVPGRAESPHAS